MSELVNQFNNSKIQSYAEFTIKVWSDLQAEELEKAINKFAPTDGKVLFNNGIKQMQVFDVTEVSLSKVEEVVNI